MKIYHNVDQIVSMRSFEAQESERFNFQKERKFFGKITQEEGWYFNPPFCINSYPIAEYEDEINRRWFFNDGKWWVKPYLRLWLADDSTYDIRCETIEECELKRKVIINMSNSRYLQV